MSWLTPALGLSAAQEQYYELALSFARQVIEPRAARFDEEEAIPDDVIRAVGREGYCAPNIDERYGGRRVDNICVGLLHAAIGSACSSVRSILTAHGMVCEVLNRWGTPTQRSKWLPALASGEAIAAFGLTETEAGSDAKAISATAVRRGTGFALSGCKHWVTAGRIAQIFLVFAKCDGRDTAFLIERDTPGLTIAPATGMLGLRGAMLASVAMDGCEVPFDQQVGGFGFGIDAVAAHALDYGRYTVAWGCLGIAHACLDKSTSHAAARLQHGKCLREHQLISAILSGMVVGVRSTALMCMHAGRLRDLEHPHSLWETCAAKYAASTMCAGIASDTVQLHGAIGCSAGHSAQRCYRDAKIMEIIEGSTQIQQLLIARLRHDAFRDNSG
jgi:glutaryl-CoA dehydrogenase (non-decarboxylating)